MTVTRATVADLSDAELLRLGAAIAGEQSTRAAHRTPQPATEIRAATHSAEASPHEHPLDRLFREAAEREGVRF